MRVSRFIIASIVTISAHLLSAQVITTDPAFPTAAGSVKIIFDATGHLASRTLPPDDKQPPISRPLIGLQAAFPLGTAILEGTQQVKLSFGTSLQSTE